MDPKRAARSIKLWASTRAPMAVWCTGVTGVYSVTGTRDTATPGSCPGSLAFPNGVLLTVKATASGHTVTFPQVIELPYATSDCVANVSGCQVSASCEMIWLARQVRYNSELALSVTDTGLVGIDSWSAYDGTSPFCTARWAVAGTRE